MLLVSYITCLLLSPGIQFQMKKSRCQSRWPEVRTDPLDFCLSNKYYLSFMLTMWSFLLIDDKFANSCMKPSIAIQHIILTFFYLILWVKKVLLARIKLLPDTAVLCSVNTFYLLTDDTCNIFLLSLVSQDMVLLVLLLSWVGTRFLLWLSLFLIKICSNFCLCLYPIIIIFNAC